MARHRPEPELPPCYAQVLPGLEPVAGEEIAESLRGEVKRTGTGIVVFRAPSIDESLLALRTTEDVFLLAWGTDKLTYRAVDLDQIRRWTAREADWERLLRLHHAVRPRPKGKPTYRLVTQMNGKHGYRRRDAQEALAKGLAGKLPASWRPAEENASVEIWLSIDNATAVCGLRLSDRTMRHRTWKHEHLPASLRPTVAAAMVRLGGASPGHVVLDPMCGAGTILGEQLLAARAMPHAAPVRIVGGDLDRTAVRAAEANLRRLGPVLLARWDATRLPLPDESVDRIVSNPPFGKQLGEPEEIEPLYRAMVREHDRVLRPGGRAVLLVADVGALNRAVRRTGWKSVRRLNVRILGQRAAITVWRKDRGSGTMPATTSLAPDEEPPDTRG
jgi:23S rRNA G2445 N2-methylase RlmL